MTMKTTTRWPPSTPSLPPFNSAVEDDLADRAFEDDLAEFAATDSDSDDGSESTGSYMYDSDGKGFF